MKTTGKFAVPDQAATARENELRRSFVGDHRYLVRSMLVFFWGPGCVYCAKQIARAENGFDDVTIDHVTPKTNGGTDEFSNLLPACQQCNSHRQHMPFANFALSIGKSQPWIDSVLGRLRAMGEIANHTQARNPIGIVAKVKQQRASRTWESLLLDEPTNSIEGNA